jgi:hypothetical protein
MCDVTDTVKCVLGTNYYPLYVVYSVLPNVWDSDFSSTKSVTGEIDATVTAG